MPHANADPERFEHEYQHWHRSNVQYLMLYFIYHRVLDKSLDELYKLQCLKYALGYLKTRIVAASRNCIWRSWIFSED